MLFRRRKSCPKWITVQPSKEVVIEAQKGPTILKCHNFSQVKVAVKVKTNSPELFFCQPVAFFLETSKEADIFIKLSSEEAIREKKESAGGLSDVKFVLLVRPLQKENLLAPYDYWTQPKTALLEHLQLIYLNVSITAENQEIDPKQQTTGAADEIAKAIQTEEYRHEQQLLEEVAEHDSDEETSLAAAIQRERPVSKRQNLGHWFQKLNTNISEKKKQNASPTARKMGSPPLNGKQGVQSEKINLRSDVKSTTFHSKSVTISGESDYHNLPREIRTPPTPPPPLPERKQLTVNLPKLSTIEENRPSKVLLVKKAGNVSRISRPQVNDGYEQPCSSKTITLDDFVPLSSGYRADYI